MLGPVWSVKSDGLKEQADIHRLFDPMLDARLPTGSESGDLYIEGYRLAAEMLIERVAETGFDRDFLVYPIGFLFRHYIELSLKDLIGIGHELADGDVASPSGHELLKLWGRARLHIEREFSGEGEQLDRAEELVSELARTDPTSQVFRYRVDTQGRPHLEDRGTLNLGEFAEVMRELLHFLEGCGCGLGGHLAIKRDLEAEFHEEMRAEWGP